MNLLPSTRRALLTPLLPALARSSIALDTICCIDALDFARSLPSDYVHCVVTSPPYFGLRDYGVAGQIGLEDSFWTYLDKLTALFREIRRVLRPDGVLWLNMGDGYASGEIGRRDSVQGRTINGRPVTSKFTQRQRSANPHPLKPKDLLLQPHRLAIRLQEDGWYVRMDNVWCLSGGTWVYTRTQKGDMPMTIKDMTRLRPETIQLWNGEKWTHVLGWSKTPRNDTELELVLRSGERITSTPNHQFPTNRGLLRADEIGLGDVLQRVTLPEPANPLRPDHISCEAAWFVGLYIAEGSLSGDCIQIAGHVKEEQRWQRVRAFAQSYGGTATQAVMGNNMNIRVYGKVICALIDQFVSGHTAKDKCFNPVAWRYSNEFLRSLLQGYLDGDGHYDKHNDRWRLGFTRNYNLERDLRVLSARLGFRLVLKMSHVAYKEGTRPTFRGEIRFSKSNHPNCKDVNEVIEIRKARCRNVYDIGVADVPHLFALASGILTHNSKPAPMPESVKDRTTRAHEYVFLMSKSERYWYDAEAIREKSSPSSHGSPRMNPGSKQITLGQNLNGSLGKWNSAIDIDRNKRSVWTINTEPTSEAHFATFPTALVDICIRAGCPVEGIVYDPFMGAGTTAIVARRLGRHYIGSELNPEYVALCERRLSQPFTLPMLAMMETTA